MVYYISHMGYLNLVQGFMYSKVSFLLIKFCQPVRDVGPAK